MKLKQIPIEFTVCQIADAKTIDLSAAFTFVGKTDEELSLVCPTDSVPPETVKREDGWRAFRIEGVLDFSLIGILAPIAQILAEEKIGIFAVSTYNTDYVLVKKEQFQAALSALSQAGYEVE